MGIWELKELPLFTPEYSHWIKEGRNVVVSRNTVICSGRFANPSRNYSLERVERGEREGTVNESRDKIHRNL